MMLRWGWVWLLGLPAVCSLGQPRADSLLALLKKTSSDSVRIHHLVALSNALLFENIDQSNAYVDEVLDIAERKDWNWARLIAYREQSYAAILRGDYPASLRFDNQRLSLSIALQDSAQITAVLNNIGDTYYSLGEFDEAYFYFTRSYQMARKRSDSLMMAIPLHNLGRVFMALGQHEVAVHHFNFSQQMSDLIGDLDGRAYNLAQLGELYIRQNDLEKAEEKLTGALRASRELNIQILQPRVLAQLARLHLLKNNPDKSAAYWDTAQAMHQQTKNRFGLAETQLGRGQLLIRQKEFSEAAHIIYAALQTARRLNARVLEAECLRELANLNEQRGEIEPAFRYFRRYQTLRDSLFSEEMRQKLFQDQIRFETEAKDFEIAALSRSSQAAQDDLKREEIIRNILVVVAALNVLLLLSMYRSGQRRKKMNKILVTHQLEIKKRTEELEALNRVKDKFFSIISHDLRSPMNTLAGILDLTEKGAIKPEEFPQLLTDLRAQFNHTRTLINNLLYWALLQMDNLKIAEEEVDVSELVEENFKLLGSFYTKPVHFINNVAAGHIARADRNMINLVLRNLIQNAIKFTPEGGRISVNIAGRDNLWRVSVRDNGVGIPPEVQKILFEKTSGYSTRGTANEKGTGLGLILCKDFVERNGGTIWFESEPDQGTTFYFTLKKR
jgi:signal transduction histidine kinase